MIHGAVVVIVKSFLLRRIASCISSGLLIREYIINNFKKRRERDRVIKPERIILLERIGFEWCDKHPRQPSWDDSFEQLRQFQQQLGHYHIITHLIKKIQLLWPGGLPIRKLYTNAGGLDTLLTLKQIQRLNYIGMAGLKGQRDHLQRFYNKQTQDYTHKIGDMVL
jgi:hypothetical protein